MADFVHLHNHSEFSLLDGLSKIPDMVSRARDLGMKAIALTDHGSLYGAIKFYHECKRQGIKPIIGVEIYMAQRSLHDKQVELDNDQTHLILLAKNNAGYKNLLKLVTISQLEGFYYKPRLDLETLAIHSEGLICLTSCVNGFIANPLLRNEEKDAERKLTKLAEIFKEGHLYLEMQKHQNVPEQEKLNVKLIELSKRFGLPLVATNDCHYINPPDAEAQEILLCVQTQTTILDTNRKLSMISSPDFYMKTPDEMTGLFIQTPTAIENTVKIASMIDLEIETGKWILPNFPVPDNKPPQEYLSELVHEKLAIRYENPTKEVLDRIEYELTIIGQKGYSTYFLIVSDFVNWAKEQEIAVGPGRGSVAGSIVSYILRITELDPISYNLPFERFLNPERPSPPDIDLDFADDRRDEVIKYVTEKYGKDKVAQIITFGRMEARQAIRDAGRALGMPYKDPDRLSKMVPPGAYGFAMTIDKALQASPDLYTAYQNEPQTKKLLDLARKLEGVARHASTHAAGVIIADKSLTDYTPLQKEVKGERIITQYDMYDLDLNVNDDAIGLLKMDFLGLRNLTILENAIKFIKETKNEAIDLEKIPLDDKKIYALITSGETTGIFQLESLGMRRLAKELKPSKTSDLSAMVALFRPGPMAWIDEFIQAKNQVRKINFLHADVKPILEETYGIVLYQEQCMQLANILAGYSLAQADNFRKAIGKKKPELMKKERDRFIKGCLKNGYTAKIAEEAFSLIEKFVGYGFNKAHSASYALIAYQTAYMKVHYPVEFMTAVLTAESRGSSGPSKNEKISQAVVECKRIGIEVLPPDINKSDTEFTIEKEKIRFGLSAIKNVGEAAISTILEARKSSPFLSLSDFVTRVDLSKVNKKTLESLIKAGALDFFGKRSSMLASIPNLLSESSAAKKRQDRGQASLFDDAVEENSKAKKTPNNTTLIDLEEFSKEERLSFEKEYLGFYLTYHPLSHLLETLERKVTHKINHLAEEKDGTIVILGGVITSIRKILTKKGTEMAFIVLEDELGSGIECVIFPKVYDQTRSFWVKDNVVLIRGTLDSKEERMAIIVERAKTLESEEN